MKASQIMCTSKILTNSCFTKQIMKIKIIAKVVYSVLVVKMFGTFSEMFWTSQRSFFEHERRIICKIRKLKQNNWI